MPLLHILGVVFHTSSAREMLLKVDFGPIWAPSKRRGPIFVSRNCPKVLPHLR